jgi:hypothetical protein
MRSSVIITSWWSNCLGLTCLHRLLAFAPGREVYIMQAGKSVVQMDRFREFLPKRVKELIYPSYILADDSAMREYLAKDALRCHEGAWFFDHDTFLLEPADHWFEAADRRFSDSKVCLCTRSPLPGAGITQPAYWLSPLRWPEGLSSFAPVPFEPKPYSKRPDLHRHPGDLIIPGKDTLVQVREELEALSMTGTFPTEGDGATRHFLASFPQHIHIGGLHLYTGVTQPPVGMSPAFFDWRRHTLMSFDAFFRNCPREWLALEDPELLRRHAEMMQTLETVQ